MALEAEKSNGKLRRRRTSSLRGEPPGDTAVPGLATMYEGGSTPPAEGSPNGSASKDRSDRPHRGRKRRKVKSLFRRWKSISLRHTWLNPLILALAIVSAYFVNPSEENPLHAALFVSYPLPRESGAGPDDLLQYGKGPKDFAFVAFYMIVLTFTREFCMQRILRPLAIKAGMKTRSKQYRFMEQGYTAMYFSIFGPFGLYVMSRTDLWFFNTDAMYTGFPHKTHDGLFKAYYLLQAAYWAQQFIVLVLMLEKPRKDFKELVAHHVITVSLIYLSYKFHFTHMGLPVYITHDVSDFFLATSKVLNYIESPIVVPYFVFFLFSWAYTRHYQNLRILRTFLPLPLPFPEHINEQIRSAASTAASSTSSFGQKLAPVLAPLSRALSNIFPHTAELIDTAPSKIQAFFQTESDFATIGPYTLDWAAEQYKCWISQYITFFLILALQLINLFWFFLILRILWRLVVRWGEQPQDDRSIESEDEQEQEERQITLEELRAEQRGDAWGGETGADIGKVDKPELHLNGVPVNGGKS